MSSGSIISGSYTSGSLFQKAWSGANGSYVTLFEQRPAYYTSHRVTTYVGGHKVVKYIPVKHPGGYKRHRIYDHAWHAYDMGLTVMNQTPFYLPGNPNPAWIASIIIPTPDSFNSNDHNALLGKISDAAAGHSFNLAVANAQDDLTIKMVVDTIGRFTRSIRYLRKGDIPSAVRALAASPRGNHVRRRPPPLTTKDVSDMWLELRYGWEPLYQDVYDGMVAYHAVYEKPRVTRFRCRIRKHREYRQTASVSSWVSARCDWYALVELTETLSVPRSLGLYDPLSVVWEVTPFSFVADWFIPIGSYLHLINTIPFLTGRFCLTEVYDTRSEGFGLGLYAPAHVIVRLKSMKRRVYSSLTVARPQFKSFPKSLSPRHIENAIALLRSVIVG